MTKAQIKRELAKYSQREKDLIRLYRRYCKIFDILDKEQELFNHYNKTEYQFLINNINNIIAEFSKLKKTGTREDTTQLLKELGGLESCKI